MQLEWGQPCHQYIGQVGCVDCGQNSMKTLGPGMKDLSLFMKISMVPIIYRDDLKCKLRISLSIQIKAPHCNSAERVGAARRTSFSTLGATFFRWFPELLQTGSLFVWSVLSAPLPDSRYASVCPSLRQELARRAQQP